MPADATRPLVRQCLPLTHGPTCWRQVRHGALLGAAELLPALARQGAADMAPCYMAKAAGLVAAVQQALFLRGKGADLMREALCR